MLKPIILTSAFLAALPAMAQNVTSPITNAIVAPGDQFSGRNVEDRVLRRVLSEDVGLTGIVMRERSDEPCHLEANYSRIGNHTDFPGTGGYFECGNTSTGTSGSQKKIDLPSPYYAVGIQVCMNSANDKVKGVALIGKTRDCILSGSTASSCYNFDTFFERTNCVGNDVDSNGDPIGPDTDWEATAECDDDEVAIGIRISDRANGGGGGRRQIDGLGLKCARVVP